MMIQVDDRMANEKSIFALSYMTLVAYLFCTPAHALSDNSQSAEPKVVQVVPSERGERNFSSERTSIKAIQILQSIYKLASSPPMNVKTIEAEFNWKVSKEIWAGDGAYVHTWFTDSYYRLHTGKPWAAPRFTDRKGIDDRSLFIALDSERFCVRSENVLTEFGSSFEKNVAVLMTPWPNQNQLSDVVKKNRDLFAFGPIYKFKFTELTTVVYFEFNFSECAVSVSIKEGKRLGEKQ